MNKHMTLKQKEIYDRLKRDEQDDVNIKSFYEMIYNHPIFRADALGGITPPDSTEIRRPPRWSEIGW